ncbi:MAG: hypothetical protein EA382_06485 [Spirochaetaceae bacterium]|nr:MAG: hypothetical protein EA382_06485 [Spirochaetaceae bacterium]
MIPFRSSADWTRQLKKWTIRGSFPTQFYCQRGSFLSDSTDSQNSPAPLPNAPVPAPQMRTVSDDTVSLLDLIAVLARRWKLIFFTTFFAAVGIVVFSIYTLRMPPDSPFNPLPNYYRAEAQVLLDTPGSSGMRGLADSELGILSGLVGLSASAGSSSAALAQELLRGNTILDSVLDEFGLIEKFADADSPRAAARKSVRDNMVVEFDASSGILTVGFEGIEPLFAADVLTRIVGMLEERFVALTRDRTQDRSRALESQLNRLDDDLERASSALTEFQRRYGVVDPVAQGQRTIAIIDQFRQQRFDLELQREQVLAIVQDRTDPQIQRFDRSIARIDGLIGELTTGFRVFTPMTIPLDQVADLTVRYVELERDLRLKQQVYTSFQAELIRAQIESQDTRRQFQVIEHPEVPLVKAGPSRGVISVIVTITAFFLAVFTAFVLEYFSRAAGDPDEARKLDFIRRQFRLRRSDR